MDSTNMANSYLQTGAWTNERHLNFLNSMEADFVRTMLEDNVRPLRLDRYLPDSSESTLDLKSQRRKKTLISDYNTVGRRSRINGRNDKRTRRLSSSSSSHRPSQDQVVPQLENRNDDNNEGDRPIPNVEIAPAN